MRQLRVPLPRRGQAVTCLSDLPSGGSDLPGDPVGPASHAGTTATAGRRLDLGGAWLLVILGLQAALSHLGLSWAGVDSSRVRTPGKAALLGIALSSSP